VSSVSFSPDGKILASGSWDNTIKLYSMPDGLLLKTLEGHTHDVESVCFSPDGKILASGSSDKTIKLWSIPDGELLKTLEAHTGFVRSISFSPDGKILASGSADSTIRLWTMPDGKPVYLLFDPAITEKTSARNIRQMGPETLTLPCGTPLPAGAVCTCDCVAKGRNYPGTNTVCTCNTITVPVETPLVANQVCVCDTIFVGTYVKPAPSDGGGGRTYYGGGGYYSYWYPS
jgi:hypothetical protein